MANILPRVIRLRDAPAYLGMSKNTFNSEVRKTLVEFKIGAKGKGFDRLDLDEWVEHTKASSKCAPLEETLWRTKKCQDSFFGMAPGGLKKCSTVVDFEKAVEQVMSRKQKNT